MIRKVHKLQSIRRDLVAGASIQSRAGSLPHVLIMGTIDPVMSTVTKPDLISRLLFGSTRREVLALLLGRPDERFYLREIVRAVGGGLGAVQRELKQLVEVGLVEREARGHQVYFSANRDAAIFPENDSSRESSGPLLACNFPVRSVSEPTNYAQMALGDSFSGSGPGR